MCYLKSKAQTPLSQIRLNQKQGVGMEEKMLHKLISDLTTSGRSFAVAGKWPLEGLAESSIKRKKKMSKTKLEEENILKNNKNESLTVHCRCPPSKLPENAGK